MTFGHFLGQPLVRPVDFSLLPLQLSSLINSIWNCETLFPPFSPILGHPQHNQPVELNSARCLLYFLNFLLFFSWTSINITKLLLSAQPWKSNSDKRYHFEIVCKSERNEIDFHDLYKTLALILKIVHKSIRGK